MSQVVLPLLLLLQVASNLNYVEALPDIIKIGKCRRARLIHIRAIRRFIRYLSIIQQHLKRVSIFFHIIIKSARVCMYVYACKYC